MKVQAMTTLLLIDGVTYQIALPEGVIALQAMHVLAISDEFGGVILPCTFANIKPMDVAGLPFEININKGVRK